MFLIFSVVWISFRVCGFFGLWFFSVMLVWFLLLMMVKVILLCDFFRC